MSKLKKAIERAGKRESTPMGFTRVEQTKRRAMLLAVGASNEKDVATGVTAGADAIPTPGSDDQSVDNCNNGNAAAEVRINGCTLAIQLGNFDEANLGILYGNRGAAYLDQGDNEQAISDAN